MLIYSDSFYIDDNGSGYSLDVRDAICSNCYKVVDRQKKYRGINEDFDFSSNEKKEWKSCPYCGTSLYEEVKHNRGHLGEYTQIKFDKPE